MRRILLITFCLLVFCCDTFAIVAQQCHKVIVAGNSDWPPYTIVTNDQMLDKHIVQGIGFDIARKIFAELDIPVEEQVYDDTTQLLEAAKLGKIDVLVSTYKTAETTASMQLLSPAYFTDHITIALPINESINVASWDNLIGLHGVEPSSFQPDENILHTINDYLQVTKQPGLLYTLQMVLSGKYNYIIGADSQLSYAIKVNKLTDKMLVKKDLFELSDVYMAFTYNSVCSPYSVYVQKRLQDYKNNGTVEKIVNKYIY